MSERRVRALLVLALLLGACKSDRTTSNQCPPVEGDLSCDGDTPECRFARLFAGRGDLPTMSEVLEGEPAELDLALRQLFPSIGDRPFADGVVTAPAALVFHLSGFDDYTVPSPIDWDANPYGNNSWQLYYQGLDWLQEYEDPTAAAWVLADYVERAMYREPRLAFTWSDHALAMRLGAVRAWFDRYVAANDVLDRRVVHATAQLVLTHVYALASDPCYRWPHNHGFMQDLALLDLLPGLSALSDREALWELAGRRLLERQIAHSTSEDGIHVENSPAYHLLYVELVTGAVAAYHRAGKPPPAELLRIQSQMVDSLIQLTQPDLTLPRFGDTSDRGRYRKLDNIRDALHAQGNVDPDVVARLDWLLDKGTSGTAPVLLDQVFTAGGYAVFRNRWDIVGSADTITAHFKTSRLSPIHYHPDETSFDLFAYGVGVLQNVGAYTYSIDDPLRNYAIEPSAANVLVVDDDRRKAPHASPKSRVVASGLTDELAWVQGTHANFADLGVTSLVRTFAYAKPDSFLVIDHVRADGRAHDYAQHFHLHPVFTDVVAIDDRTVVARTADGTGPTVVLMAAGAPDSIDLPQGQLGDDPHGWYFPEMYVKEPAVEVIFRSRSDDAELDLPVLILLVPPGAELDLPSTFTYVESGDECTARWAGRAVTVPNPD